MTDTDEDRTNKCGLTAKNSNLIDVGFGGIPDSLLFYGCILWPIMMIIFLVARKSVFKALSKNLHNNWSQMVSLIVPPGDSTDSPTLASYPPSGHQDSPDTSSIPPSELQPQTSETIFDEEQLRLRTMELNRLKASGDVGGGGLCYFFQDAFRFLSFDDEIMSNLAGEDGVQYLRFQRHLILLAAVISIYSLVIIPINYYGGSQYSNSTDLGIVSINNIEPTDNLLYIHTILAFSMFPICLLVMRHYSGTLDFRDVTLEITKTLQIGNIPKHLCKEDIIRQHFAEAYPRLKIRAVSVAFDVAELVHLATFLRDAMDAKEYCEVYYDKNPGKSLSMKPSCCSRLCSCCCVCKPTVDVKDFYTEEVERLKRDVERQTEISLNSPIGIAFVTFESLNSSKKVYDDFQPSIYRLNFKNPSLSSMSMSLKPERWKVRFAPSPRDIYWHALEDNTIVLTLKSKFSDLIMLVIILFFTTPIQAATEMDKILGYINNKVFEFPTTLINLAQSSFLTVAFIVLPSVITVSVRWMGSWYRSEENYQVMVKIFWFLWFCLILSPLVGVTAMIPLLENYFGPSSNSSNSPQGFQWECLKMADDGAMFVNNVISNAFFGTGFELLRVTEFLMYVLCLSCARTKANYPSIKRSVAFEFRFGENYARILIMFSLTVLLSLVQPLISPFGLVYFILKYVSDKHNLAWVYLPSEIDQKVHKSAIKIVIFAVVFEQIYLTALGLLRNSDIEYFSGSSILSLILLGFTIVTFCSQAFSGLCKKMSPIKYVEPIFEEDENILPDTEGQFIPAVLTKALRERNSRRRQSVVNEEDSNENNDTSHGSENNIALRKL